MEDSYRDRLKDKGLSWEELVARRHVEDIDPQYRKYEQRGFATPTGKVELCSTILEKLGYDPLPVVGSCSVSREACAEGDPEYPLTLINGARVKEYVLSTWRDVPSMRRHYPDPVVRIHPDTAREYGVEDGAWIWIESRKGRIRQRCSYFDGLQRDVIHCDAQWWYPELPGGEPWLHGVWTSNVNVLLEADPDLCNPVIGSWPQRICAVRIAR